MNVTMTELPVRILHLSDLHFSTRSRWDSDPILCALARFIAADVTDNGLHPDLVVITGDLAQSGKPKEYGLARQWLDDLWPRLTPDPAAPLDRDRLLLVPGNHDVDWDLIEPGARDAHQAMLDAKDQKEITSRLDPKSVTRNLLLKRHAAYLKFYGHWLGQRQTLPWWQRSIPIRKQRLHVAGLDSAWLAEHDDDSHLLLSTYQINQTVLHKDAEAEHDWRLALLHHPWASLAEFDRNDARRTLHRHRDLILSGHLHQPDLFRIVPADPRYACIEAAAGCCYSGKPYPNAFQWIELSTRPRRVEFHFRCWNRDDWQVDRNQHGCPQGMHRILCPVPADAVQVPPTPRSPGRSAEPTGPTNGQPEGPRATQATAFLGDDVALAERAQAAPGRTEQADKPMGPADGQPEGPEPTQTSAITADLRTAVDRDQAASRVQLESVSPFASQPRVFISYAQHSQRHSAAVLAVATALADDGIAVELDQFHSAEMLHWPRWCEEQLRPERSDFVLMVCSAEYRRRIQNQVNWDEGRGVFWEGQLIYNALYLAKDNKRYVPVLLDDEPQTSIPDVMGGWTFFRLRGLGRGAAEPQYLRLLRLLCGPAPRPAADLPPGLPIDDQAIGPNPDPRVGVSVGVSSVAPDPASRRPATLPEDAEREIRTALEASPTLCLALAKQLAAASIPAPLAARLCDPDADFLAALDALDQALCALARLPRLAPDAAAKQLREDALTILGWTVVGTVADGCEREDAALVADKWRQGDVFEVPLGRGPCVEVLTARWRGGKAEFSIGTATVDASPFDLAPAVMQELGFDDPQLLTPDRAVDAVINRVYQESTRGQGNDRPTAARRKDAASWLRAQVRNHKHRFRLVVDLNHPLADPDVLRAIKLELKELLLILVNDQADEDSSVFILPPADLTNAIRDCLAAIGTLP
ncbi:metallophosphoesterase [uncultured Thiodictyon sp.]|jgi:hypothetical protein|uniref:metallophosphoesterase family protein n=1 Tax=uncultured Thiodictyon sp. TaxID=1846217 RepID=UPI0025DC5FB0|nr:metallophosphoesterase [uncultured Thiodictyon sp.]